MSYSVEFGNKGIGVDVNFGQGGAISVPVNINSLDTDKIADRLAEKLQLPEIDLSAVAKQGENQEATMSKVYDAVKSIPDMSLLYAARAEKNDDGENTYTIVLPVTAKTVLDDNGVATIQL